MNENRKEKIDSELFNYLIENLNKQSLDIKTNKDKDYILKETFKLFKDYLINNEPKLKTNNKLKTLFKDNNITNISEFQPIISLNKNGEKYINKCEVLSSFKLNVSDENNNDNNDNDNNITLQQK